MSFSILLDKEALRDLEDAIRYYEERETGLGLSFRDHIDQHFKTLRTNPYFQVRYHNVRCLPVRKFPYMIHFEVDERSNSVIVIAVLNTNLDPKKWKKPQ